MMILVKVDGYKQKRERKIMNYDDFEFKLNLGRECLVLCMK